MKRFILSSITLASFVFFSFYYRSMGQSSLLAVLPENNTNTESSPTPTSKPAITKAPALANNFILPIKTQSLAVNTGYKNGSFIGAVTDAFYGYIQVQAVIANGKITDLQFLQYPNDRSHSIVINQYALPILKSEAIQGQSAHVDIVSGATDSSRAFIESLQSALNKAKT